MKIYRKLSRKKINFFKLTSLSSINSLLTQRILQIFDGQITI